MLDPVGVGASALRLRTAQELMARVTFTVLRGNVSELRALAGGQEHTRGVDAGGADAVTEAELERGVAFAKGTARRTGTVVAVTGAIDLVSDGEQCVVIRNGRPEMGLVTGTGCQLSALTAACLAASPERPWRRPPPRCAPWEWRGSWPGRGCPLRTETLPIGIGSLTLCAGWTARRWRKEPTMRCDKKDLLLYGVTDRSWLGDRTLANRWRHPCGGAPP